MKKILIVLGTRPEGIKMAPLFRVLKNASSDFDVRLCSTGQHSEMLDQVFDFFNIKPNYSLAVMQPNQTLTEVTQLILHKLDPVLEDYRPDIVLVQGDTTTVLAGALAAFYRGIKIGHVEAGLRTWNIHTPFPEEANRVLVSKIADYHFAPTQAAVDNLIRDGVGESKIFLVGNTVTDAVLIASQLIHKSNTSSEKFSNINFEQKKVILLTSHRRENLGKRLEAICQAVKELAERKDVEIIFPMHRNPKVRETVYKTLSGLQNVHLYEPFDYADLVWLLNNCFMVLTDSGGIQEEAPTLGKPVLVLRESTERPEGVDAGTAKLVGLTKDAIVKAAVLLLDDQVSYMQMAQAISPYGDGHCSEKILEVLKKI